MHLYVDIESSIRFSFQRLSVSLVLYILYILFSYTFASFRKFIRDRLDKPNDVRRLKFYLGTPDMEKDFLLECLSGGRKQVLVDIHKDDDVALQQQAGDVVDYMNLLKRRMAPDLNTDFDQFKKYLGKLEN